jgi:hypothetical protein
LPKIFLPTRERALGKDSLGNSKSTFRNYAAVMGWGNFPMSVSAHYNPHCTWNAQETYKHCEKRKQIVYGKKNDDITHTHTHNMHSPHIYTLKVTKRCIAYHEMPNYDETQSSSPYSQKPVVYLIFSPLDPVYIVIITSLLCYLILFPVLTAKLHVVCNYRFMHACYMYHPSQM